jgi:hypothetical protein
MKFRWLKRSRFLYQVCVRGRKIFENTESNVLVLAELYLTTAVTSGFRFMR